MIHIEKEAPEIKDQFYGELEHCFFCLQKTEWWNKESNTPVCPDCAEIYNEEELPA